MKKLIILILSVLLLTGCLFDRYQIKEGERKPEFIPVLFNNNKGHLFWFNLKDEDGKYIIDDNKRKVMFDEERDTIIYVHGWQGVGLLGWTRHTLVTEKPLIAMPFTAIISMMYNVPGLGAAFPTIKQRITDFNFAIFDWQLYNNIASEYENTENLAELEDNLRDNPKDWPLIPENLAKELEFFVKKTNYTKNIILTAHSLGSQVVLRAYEMLSQDVRDKIKLVVFLDPFSSNHFEYMYDKLDKNYKWLTGATNPRVKRELNNLIQNNDIKAKLYVIISTDIGASWVYNFAKPNDLPVIDKDFQDIKFNASYGRLVKKYHEDILDWFFSEKKYDKEVGIIK